MKAIPLVIAPLLLVYAGCTTLTEKIQNFIDPPPETVAEALPVPSGFRKKILVLPFINRTSYETENLQDPVFYEMKSAALGAPDVVMITENEIDKGENVLGDESGYHFRVIFDVARAHGFSGVIVGSIDDLALDYRSDEVGLFPTYQYQLQAKVSFQLYETATERELISRSGSANLSQEYVRFQDQRGPDSDDTHRLQDAVAHATRKAALGFPLYSRRVAWGGQIVKIDQHRYYINAGEETGITKGQLLKVMGEGFSIVDDKTKVKLGQASGPFKGILKIVDYLGRDGAVAVVHSGGAFRERDRVEIYTPTP